MFPTGLQFVKSNINSALKVFDVFKHDNSLADYSTPSLAAARVVESMIVVVLEENGFKFENGLCIESGPGYNRFPRMSPLTMFNRHIHELGLPVQLGEFVRIIRDYRNASAHMAVVDYDEFLIFFEAFSFFVGWFVEDYGVINRLEPESYEEFLDYVRRIRSTYVRWVIIDSQSEEKMISSSEVDAVLKMVSNQQTDANPAIEMMGILLESFNQLKEGVVRLETKIDSMAGQLSVIYDKMTDYQALLERQISIAASEDEVDRIIKAYSDEVSNRIIHEVETSFGNSEFEAEEKSLQDSLGEVVWKRLDPSSKEFLVTAKVTYRNYGKIGKAVDYSGVCLLVTKAIEVEMSNRFCRDYLAHLKAKYPGKANYPQYPVVMLNKYGKPIKPKDFTLGSVAYVLAAQVDSELDAAVAQKIRDEILDFCQSKIMKGKDVAYITDTLEEIADEIEKVRKDYRNPSAHTNQLQKINAKECFDLVLDVEKILKTIIESLDY